MKVLMFVSFPLVVSLAAGQWSQSSGPGVAGVNILLHQGEAIYAGTDIEGVYRSTDDGATWQPFNTGIEGASIHSLAENSTYIFAGVDLDYRGHAGVYRASPEGLTWTPVNNGISTTVSALLADGNTLYAGTIGFGVYKSTDNGDTWDLSNSGMGDEFVNSIVKSGGVLFARGSNNLYRSDDDGATWQFTDGGQYFQIFTMGVEGNYIYAGGFQGIIRSSDSGNTWSTRIDILILNSVTHISGFDFQDSTIFASTSIGPGSGVIKSTDHGLSWSLINSGIETVSFNSILNHSGSLIVGGSSKGIMISNDEGASWAKSNTGLPPGGSIRRLLAVDNSVVAGTGGDGIYQSTDNGLSWNEINNDGLGILRNEIVRAVAYDGGVLLAGTIYNGIFRSTDGGVSWEQSNNGLPSGEAILSMTVASPNVLAGTGDGIFSSSDKGVTWNVTDLGNATVDELSADAGIAYALANTGFSISTGIYRSTTNGTSWDLVQTSGFDTYVGLSAQGSNVVTGSFSPGGVRSIDFGVIWFGYSISDANGVYSLLHDDSVLYAGTGVQSQGIYRSTDAGASFTSFNDGFISFTSVEALASNNGYLFAGTNDRAVWVRPVGNPTGIDNPKPTTPGTYRLRQNYPNPFNPSTTILFDTPRAGRIRLKVFDILGNEVTTLFDGVIAAGTHSANWNAADFPSGIYFYRLESSGFTGTGKMALVK